MYDTIVNPVSSRQVKTSSKLGKKLLYNYEDKFDYVINPETNKIVQSGGKVGQQVLKKYKQKIVSTNVGGRGGKKKTKRGGTGPDQGREQREQREHYESQARLNAPRTYTCKSIDNSTNENKTEVVVKCENNKCTPNERNFETFITEQHGKEHGVQCIGKNGTYGTYEFAKIENRYTLKLPDGLCLKKIIHEEWAKFKILSKSSEDPIYFTKNNGSKKYGYLLQELLLNSMSKKMLVPESKHLYEQYIQAISTDTTSPLLFDFWTTIQKGVEEIIETRPKVFINKTDQEANDNISFESFLEHQVNNPEQVQNAWAIFSKITGIKDPLDCLWRDLAINKCKKTTNLNALKDFYSAILGNNMQNILLILPRNKTTPVLKWMKNDDLFWKRIWEMLNTPKDKSIFNTYINESTKKFIQEEWEKLLNSKNNSSLSPHKCKVYLENNECSSYPGSYGKNSFIENILSNNKSDKKFNSKLMKLVKEQGLLNKRFWDDIATLVLPVSGEQGAQAAEAPAEAPREQGAKPVASAAAPPVDIKKIITNWNNYMKHIPTPRSCVKGSGMNLCRGLRGYGRDLRSQFYTDIGLTKEYIKNIKEDEKVSKSFWSNVYLVLKTHYEESLNRLMNNNEVVAMWTIFKKSFDKLPDYSGRRRSADLNPLECRIVADVNRCKDNMDQIKKFVGEVLKHAGKSVPIYTIDDILENRFLNDLFWTKINEIVEVSEYGLVPAADLDIDLLNNLIDNKAFINLFNNEFYPCLFINPGLFIDPLNRCDLKISQFQPEVHMHHQYTIGTSVNTYLHHWWISSEKLKQFINTNYERFKNKNGNLPENEHKKFFTMIRKALKLLRTESIKYIMDKLATKAAVVAA
jgi:hypothetical protein